MPCNTRTKQLLSEKLSNALPSVLADALTAEGYAIHERLPGSIRATMGSAYVTWTKGTGLTIQSRNPAQDLQTVTQAYSRAAVTYAAQRAGWTVQTNSPTSITLRK